MTVEVAHRFKCDLCERETRWGWVGMDLRAARKDLAKRLGWQYKRLKVGGYVDLCDHCRGTIG